MNKVILLHGFNKNSNDMKVLQWNLSKHNFGCILVDLPLTFKKIEHCAFVFGETFENLVRDMNPGEKI